MSQWNRRLLKRARQLCQYLLLPLIIIVLTIKLHDSLRAPILPADFATRSLHTIDGRDLTLAELSAKKPLVVWFWNRWCAACQDSLPLMMRLDGKRIGVLTVAVRSGDDIGIVRYLQGHHLAVPVVNDSRGELADSWQVTASPTMIIVAKGEAVSTTSGWTSDLGVWVRLWWVRKWQY